MHFQPRVNSPLNSLLKNSRVSDRSTEGDRSFKFNHSFDFESSFIESPANKNITLSTLSSPSAQLQTISSTTPQRTTQETKRNYLTKVLINRMINVRQALKTIQSLPIKIFKKNASFGIAKEIVMRSKISIETSILRTLIYAQEQRNGQESKLKYSSSGNVFVLPTPNKKDTGRAKRALLDLSTLVKIQTKRVVKAFALHCQEQQTISRYFRKILANQWRMIETAFEKFKQLPSISSKAKEQHTQSQLKLTARIIQSKYRSLLQHSFIAIKSNGHSLKQRQETAARQIIAFSRMRKEQCLKEWLLLAKTTKLRQEKQAEVAAEKVEALTRIVQRNYIKLFGQIIRRIHVFKVAAHRIGCNSKINQQKSLWRLRAYMQRQLHSDHHHNKQH